MQCCLVSARIPAFAHCASVSLSLVWRFTTAAMSPSSISTSTFIKLIKSFQFPLSQAVAWLLISKLRYLFKRTLLSIRKRWFGIQIYLVVFSLKYVGVFYHKLPFFNTSWSHSLSSRFIMLILSFSSSSNLFGFAADLGIGGRAHQLECARLCLPTQ